MIEHIVVDQKRQLKDVSPFGCITIIRFNGYFSAKLAPQIIEITISIVDFLRLCKLHFVEAEEMPLQMIDVV